VTDKRLDLVLRILLALNCVALLGYTLVGLQLNYSYWTDELFSVVMATQSLSTQWEILLSDVHPPLYQAILHIWTRFLGTSELATRTLSALFILSGFPAIVALANAFGKRLAILSGILLASNWLLYEHAQETRGYALLLCLSVWVFTYFVTGERRMIFPFLVLLGLTHFFGTLLSCLCLIWIVFEHPARTRTILACFVSGTLILTWPIIFMLFGDARNVVGGNFWIDSSLRDVALHALHAVYPFGLGVLGLTGLIAFGAVPALGLLIFISMGTLATVTRMPCQDETLRSGLLRSTYVLLVFVVIVIFINQFTPVSTTRNFIVLAPAGAFVLAVFFEFLLSKMERRNVAIAFLGIFLIIHQLMVLGKMTERFSPIQDWRAASTALMQALQTNPQRTVFVYDSFPSLEIEGFNEQWFSFYFENAVTFEILPVESLDMIPADSLIFFGQVDGALDGRGGCENDLTELLDAHNVRHDAWFAEQAFACATGYASLVDR
jgi:hypothetical protein